MTPPAIAADDVVALLEDGPHHEHELIAWLGRPADLVRHELKRLQIGGVLKRIGTDRQWALCEAAVPIAKPADARDVNLEILAALTAGPCEATALADLLVVGQTTIIRHLRDELEPACAVKRVGAGNQTRWALAAWEPAVAILPRRPALVPKARPTERDPAWWVGLGREEFSRQIVQRDADRAKTGSSGPRIRETP
jgi:hypothetical protein